MTEIYLKDNIEIDTIKKNVNLCRTGEYQYLAKELGLTDRQPNDIIKVFRDENSIKQVIDKINEYQAIPILINHPDKFVDLSDTMNYKRGGVGKSKLKKIGDSQVATAKIIAISDDTKELVDKKSEVSMGYTAELVQSTNPLYDYTLNIKDVNHLALVNYGRAGSLCSIQDKSIDYKQLITDKLNEEEKELNDGGAGSGNFGHDGRPGEVGGSQSTSQGNLTTSQRERITYGRKLRELSEVFGADNIGKVYKEKIQKELEISEKAKRQEEVSGKVIAKFYGSSDNYQKGDQKRTTKTLNREMGKVLNPNYKPEFRTLVTTPRGAKLIQKDGKVAWVMSKMIRENGTLTKGGLEVLQKGETVEQYEAKQNINKQVIETKVNVQNDFRKSLIEKTGYNEEKDDSDKPFIKMKLRLAEQNPVAFEKIKNTNFKMPENIRGILSNDYTAFMQVNYWQTPDESKRRLYYNVVNKKGYQYPLTKNYEEL